MEVKLKMTKNMQIKNAVYEKLTEIKGNRSYSEVIESLLNKNGIVMPDSRSKHADTTATA